MITEKNHKLLTSQLFVTDCTKKGLASMRNGIKIQSVCFLVMKLPGTILHRAGLKFNSPFVNTAALAS